AADAHLLAQVARHEPLRQPAPEGAAEGRDEAVGLGEVSLQGRRLVIQKTHSPDSSRLRGRAEVTASRSMGPYTGGNNSPEPAASAFNGLLSLAGSIRNTSSSSADPQKRFAAPATR